MAEYGFELSTPFSIQLVSGAVPLESGSKAFWDPLEDVRWMTAMGSKVQVRVSRFGIHVKVDVTILQC